MDVIRTLAENAVSANCPRRNSLTAVVFRLMLAISLWEGPILWGHQHSSNSTGMATHIARCHACDESPQSLGWHWHVSLPVQGDPSSSKGDDVPQTNLPRTVAPSVTDVAGTLQAGLSVAPFSVPITGRFLSLGYEALPPSGRGGFLASYSPAHSRQQLLCRLSC